MLFIHHSSYTTNVGVKVVDDPANKLYPMPMTATNQFDIEVGRIRENDVFGEYGLDLFVSGDQVRMCHD